jgi:integrase
VRKQPKISWHPPSRRAYLTWHGKRYYLGAWEHQDKPIPKDVKAKYDALLGQLLYLGKPEEKALPVGLTVHEISARFMDWAEGRTDPADYRGCAKATQGLCTLSGMVEAKDFSPGQLRKVQDYFLGKGWVRDQVNKQVRRVVRVFSWAISWDLIPASVLVGLKTVPPVRAGTPGTTEGSPINPVPLDLIKATLPHLTEPFRSMVKIQLLTGCRPGEVRLMRCGEIVQDGAAWLYRPIHHKNAHRGKIREIPLSAPAMKILRPFLKGRPAEAMVFPSGAGSGDEARPYVINTYSQTIRKICRAHGLTTWQPRQLRKTVAQEVDNLLGIEHSAALAGHSGIEITRRIYAKSQLEKAKVAAKKIEKML